MFSKRVVKVGKLTIGGSNSVVIQSMLNKFSEDVNGNLEQAANLEKTGCELIRISVPNKASLKTVYALKKALNTPIVADIHFNYKMAIESIYAGVDKIRINPGTIEKSNVKSIVAACLQNNIPIRVGINSGSIPVQILKAKGRTPEGLVAAALDSVALLNRFDFDNIIISVKSSNVLKTIKAYKLLALDCDYPLHLGVTESGNLEAGVVKSAIGVGVLLADGIGDTIRVSLTGDPLGEIVIAKEILKALDLKKGLNVISCPTCGRTRVDVTKIVNLLKQALIERHLDDLDMKVAVMGCVVNGSGEAKEADFGIVAGDGCGVIFKKGEVIKKVAEECLVKELIKLIEEGKKGEV
ncbi:MAG: flavodoxin-dependent (E)-4-hydroxy-3-methylbut-2-enyl-diphosphate synthase [Oscillospiraceae bacterium]|jgi:(E)-4-hydroxy-3-methylbut-2-enyl-diphosphate synthase|nr:flavodoxin-dependent (E)-4-hydroxy-3-methylbut-2-enyl-diphosphate synthase [Oscillospiraceae bacterium]